MVNALWDEEHTRKFSLAISAIALLGLGAVPASAAVVTKSYSFSLGGFIDVNDISPLPSPLSAITGSFTVTFDPTLSYDNDTADVSVTLNGTPTAPTIDSPLGFTYFGSGLYAGDFFLGGTANDSDFVSAGTNDFVLSYNLSDLNNPQFINCGAVGVVCGLQTGNSAYDGSGYTEAGSNAVWFIGADQSVTSAVPEPLTLSLFGAGVAGAAAIRRRRKKV
jgi:hypothetical protein